MSVKFSAHIKESTNLSVNLSRNPSSSLGGSLSKDLIKNASYRSMWELAFEYMCKFK